MNGQEVADFDPLDGVAPLTFLMDAVAGRARGEEVDDDKVRYAASLAACATLVDAGIGIDVAVGAVEQAMSRGSLRVSWSEVDGLQVEFGEGVAAGRSL